MREQLIQYVNLLFAGAPDSDEIKQEILQNTLDRFDDLVSQGKSPEAAYRLAISGIGDINEILGNTPHTTATPPRTVNRIPQPESEEDIKRKQIRAFGIFLYIVCALPLIILSDLGLDTLGLTMTILLAATATYLMIITGKDEPEDVINEKPEAENPMKENIGKIIWVTGLIAYFGISFATGAWYITWLIFPIIACVRGLSDAIIDLKEANNYEN